MSNAHDLFTAKLTAALPVAAPIDTDAVTIPHFFRILESARVAIRSKVKTNAGGTFELLGAVRTTEKYATDSRVLLVYRAASNAVYPNEIHLCNPSTLSAGSLAVAFAAFKLTA
jgi:hypothetical protein